MRELKKRHRLLEQENDVLRRAVAYLARDINPNGTGSMRTSSTPPGTSTPTTRHSVTGSSPTSSRRRASQRGENRVQRLCGDHGIWSVFSTKRGLNRKRGPPVHDDLVERDFTAAVAK